MAIERMSTTWVTMPWKEEMSHEDLLIIRIKQLERKLEDIKNALI